MEQFFMTNLAINKVRHLKDISISLSKDQIKHLILTGKNGSGKTSVLEALAGYLNDGLSENYFIDGEQGAKDFIIRDRINCPGSPPRSSTTVRTASHIIGASCHSSISLGVAPCKRFEGRV